MVRTLWVLLWAALVVPSAEGCPAFSQLAPNGRPTLSQKKHWLASSTALRGTFSEIGAGHAISSSLREENLRFPLVTVIPYDRSASDSRYGKAGEGFETHVYVSLTRLRQQLREEFRRMGPGIQPLPFVVANTAATRRGDGNAWLGFRGVLKPGAPAVEFVLHVRLLEHRTTHQKETLGKLGINLLYALHHYRDQPAQWVRSLSDGVVPGAVIIDYLEATGPPEAFHPALRSSPVLLEFGATPYLLFDPQGSPTHPVSVRESGAFDLVPDNGTTPLQVIAGDGAPRPGWHLRVNDPSLGTSAFLQAIRPQEQNRPRPGELNWAEGSRDTVDWMARRLNATDRLKGSLLEMGAGQRTVGRILEAPFGHTLYLANAYPSVREARRHYRELRHSEGDLSWDLLERLARRQLNEIQLHHFDYRRFALVSAFHGNRGRILVAGEIQPGGPVSVRTMEFRLNPTSETERQELVGALGVEALYRFYHGSEGAPVGLPEAYDPKRVPYRQGDDLFRASAATDSQ